MTGFIYTNALREYLRPKRLLPWIGVSFIALLIAFNWHRMSQGTTLRDQYAQVIQMIVFHLVGLMSAIYTTAIVSSEVEQKTIVYLLTRPLPRWQLLLGRYLASVTVVFLLGTFAALLVSAGIFHGEALSNDLLLNDIKAIGMGAVTYGGLFLIVSLLFNRAMIICLLFAFGWEMSIPNMPGDLYRASIFSYMQAIAEHPSTDVASAAGGKKLALVTGEFGNNILSASAAYTTMVVLTLFFVALSAYWFTKFEYVPREDAE